MSDTKPMQRLRWAAIASIAVPVLLFVCAAWFDHEQSFAWPAQGAQPIAELLHGRAAGIWTRHLLVLGAICTVMAAAVAVPVLLAMREMRRLAEEPDPRVMTEAASRHAERMEALGHLAVGLVHDLRNVMQAVDGAATLIERDAGSNERVRSLAGMICRAIARGNELTRRIMELARDDQVGVVGDLDAVTDPAEAVCGACDLVSCAFGPAHRLRCEIERAGLPAQVRGDRAELETALMNLAANARDSMPTGGDVLVRVTSERVAESHVAGLPPGLYARVSMADTGEGMPPEVLARAGLRYFTTKPRGKGTGLGLARARGFAERWGGALHVESERGRGTTVTLWLPMTAGSRERPLG